MAWRNGRTRGNVRRMIRGIRYGLVVWRSYLRVRWELARAPLPAAVSRIGTVRVTRARHPRAAAWSRYVPAALRHGPHRPRCLLEALTLYRLLVRAGHSPELVIGLPTTPTNHIAHAWVELDGVDLGPSPGRSHEALTRFAPAPT